MSKLLRPLRWVERALAWLAVDIVRLYQKCLSPLLPSVCRFRPTCSEYMIQAIRKKGLFIGLLKGIWRILRCNPLFPGGYDPV